MKDKKTKLSNPYDKLLRLWNNRVESLRTTKLLFTRQDSKDNPERKALKELLTTVADTIEQCAEELRNPPEEPKKSFEKAAEEEVLAEATRKVVWISTTHIMGGDLLLLNNRYPLCVGVFGDNPSSVRIDSSRVPAHIIHVDTEDLKKDTIASGFSDKFLDILATTRDLGYEYVVFDRDADVFPCWEVFSHD